MANSIELGLLDTKRNHAAIALIKVCDDARVQLAQLRQDAKGDRELYNYLYSMSLALSKDINRMSRKILDSMDYEDTSR